MKSVRRSYLAALFLDGRMAGFVIFPVGSIPVFAKPGVKMWKLAECHRVQHLILRASEYRRGRLFRHKPMSQWR